MGPPTWGGGLNRFDAVLGTFKAYPDVPRIQDIHESSDGTLWLGTVAGLFRFDPAVGTSEVYRNIPGDLASLSYDEV